MSFRAVIFDLGGVVLGSPLQAIAHYESELGIPVGSVTRVVAASGPGGAWSRLERGELAMEDFYPAFEEDCGRAGHSLSARTLMDRIHASAEPRPAMLAAVACIRRRGLSVAALTNNWASEELGMSVLQPHFDLFVESSVVGMRKPDPRIYQHTCKELGIEPKQAVFLDDIGANLKPARAMGMTTLKVTDPDEALSELTTLLGFALKED